jgi:hypothetical protein
MARQNRILVGLACALLAAACGAAPADSPEVAVEGGPVQPAATDGACRNGAPLPITGLCNTADPALFLAVDNTIETFATRCIWRTEEVQLSADDALVFRAQDCSPEGWVRTVYTRVGGYLKHRMDGTPEDQAGFALQIFPLTQGETPEDAAMKTLSLAPEDQRGRCVVAKLPGPKLAGYAFELKPGQELKAELDALYPDEPYDACGPNGFTGDAMQLWEGRKSVALFHMLGQDTPPWDPASFTFYHRGADGKWAKVN